MRIPEGFVLGTATAAWQIEGADGRGRSIWDTFTGGLGDVACDHYHRWPADVALMKALGLRHYRFSIAWPRVLPAGTGAVSPAGLDFYARLVDGLLEAGIEPWPTLYHWDLPQPLEDRGGWPNRDTALAFGDYAWVVLERLGDRVRHWFTLNEPWCSAVLGYSTGEHAPGRREGLPVVRNAIHHLLLAHGLGVQAVRARSTGRVGIVLNPLVPFPLTEDPADLEACELAWQEHTGWWLEPLYFGRYPGEYACAAEDLRIISAPTDFLGLNVYFPMFVRGVAGGYRDLQETVDLPRTAMGWPVYPPVLSHALLEVWRRYRPPVLYVTENGCASPDAVDPEGRVLDLFRREYLRQHLGETLRAREAGAPVQGYFAWSFMDNLEWAHGSDKRFGLVYVDFATQQRVVKSSGLWYSRVAREGLL